MWTQNAQGGFAIREITEYPSDMMAGVVQVGEAMDLNDPFAELDRARASWASLSLLLLCDVNSHRGRDIGYSIAVIFLIRYLCLYNFSHTRHDRPPLHDSASSSLPSAVKYLIARAVAVVGVQAYPVILLHRLNDDLCMVDRDIDRFAVFILTWEH